MSIHLSLVLGFHISLLPFHAHGFNVLRGGIFATVLWSLITSAITSSYATDSNGVDGMMPLVLLAMMPAVFNPTLHSWSDARAPQKGPGPH